MDDPANVGHAKRPGDIQPDASRLGGCQPADPPQPGGQVLAFDQVHHEERLAVVRASFQTGHDVRMAQHRGRQRLAPEAHRDIGVLDHLAPEQLDRDRPAGSGIERAMDRRHPADPDDRTQPVAAADHPIRLRRRGRRILRLAHGATIAEVPRTGPRMRVGNAAVPGGQGLRVALRCGPTMLETPPASCSRCEALVPADARFCASCGQALIEASETDQARQARLTAAAPSPLIAKMRSAKLTGERKPVTALFADVVGSTALAERMDAEDWTAMMNEAFDRMSKAVFQYEGTIAQLQGDAMVAFFGAPVAHEDDPDRAVRAALDMVAAIDEFARQLKTTEGIDFRIRAGISTGPVVVGTVGSDLRYEYTALGDAMNTAARMQAAAEPGTVLITSNTERLVATAFELNDLGEIAVKGKAEPVHAYRVVGAKVEPERRRGLERAGLESAMVGREEELETIRGLFRVAQAGRSRVAFLVAEPGLGKSRLLAEFHAWTASGTAIDVGPSAPARWIEGHCVSYGRTLPYHLLIDVVRSALKIPFGESDAEARSRLDEGLAAHLGDGGADIAAYLAHLLSLPLHQDEADRALLDPETMQGRYIAAIHRVLRAFASVGPVVLVLEDLHWADPASVAALNQLLPLAAQLPVLFIGATRAEPDSDGWRLIDTARELIGSDLVEIRLQPLSGADSRELVANLLEIESLPNAVRDSILARAEGNPFFVEEVIRMLIEQGVIERRADQWVATSEVGAVEIPETLHGLLLARIDQLPDAAKRSLRVASVIGRQFPVRVLERVLDETTE